MMIVDVLNIYNKQNKSKVSFYNTNKTKIWLWEKGSLSSDKGENFFKNNEKNTNTTS